MKTAEVRLLTALGALLAGLSVAAGAFGAHALQNLLSERYLTIYETASRYMMYHALGILMCGLSSYAGGPDLRKPGWLFVAGIALFCGSLYTLVATGISWLGAVTPFGGVLFLVGWSWAAYAIFVAQRRDRDQNTEQ
ncbi:MAG: hypothetical protein CMN76_04885 [Spirochaetaceae bacterium]|nr:hypothetical protein [Spirochaetaceae bacterium]|tara:strand:- start:453714 stop:454124 length:411 start_codon:yes stop_codon:yes gene_type:complete